ncbi:MAG: hypothetical protein NZM43_00640 [Saprospiraceae bacterium]|nr:hypothetical protein [Saprospiraceae bacterium]MDW8482809.1 hypothetical protein [Saprospiraceae bacterium]
MKYIYLLVWFSASFLTAGLAQAQDRIFLRQGRVIEARILEITSSTVRFQRADYPEGPVYVYESCDIDYIHLANGSVERFAPCRKEANQNSQREPSREYRALPPVVVTSPGCIYYRGGCFLLNDQFISMRLARVHIQERCPDALPTFDKGRELYTTGQALTWSGLFVSTGGLCLALIRMLDRDIEWSSLNSFAGSSSNTDTSGKSSAGGWLLFAGGTVALVAGIVNIARSTDFFELAAYQCTKQLSNREEIPSLQEEPKWSVSFKPVGLGAGMVVRF